MNRALFRCLASESVLAVCVAASATVLFQRRDSWEGAGLLMFGGLFISFAIAVMKRAGTLRLARNFPRVDALRLPLPQSDAAWKAVASGEAALRALHRDARAYEAFFPDARNDIRLALSQALEPHAGVESVRRIASSLETIESRLREIRARPLSPEAEPLRMLTQRSTALADAVKELAR